MGLLFGLAAGLLLGVVLMAGWDYAMNRRSRLRIFKAMHIAVLGEIGQDELKKLCGDNYPLWLSFPTFERVRWLNKQLEKIWPYVAQAASDVIKASVEPVLEQYRPVGITSLKFSKLFLGNVAPQIEGIRIQRLKKGMITMDMEVRWGGDPSIILGVQTLVGANLPVQLKNLKFFATVRAYFKLAEDIPCIAGVAVALLAKPRPVIKYTLKVIGGSLSAAPGLSDMIEDLVETSVSDTLQWPHRIVVPIAPPPVDLSELELKLEGKVIVTIQRASGLKNLEIVGKSDPYVEVYIRVLFKFRTRTISNNLNPEWNETFELDVEDRETQNLILKVADEDVVTDKLLGVASYPLAKLRPDETVELTCPLLPSLDMENVKDKKDRGSIMISLKYHVYTKEEQVAAMEKEKALLEAREKAKEGLISGTMGAIGGVVGGAGKLVGAGAGMVGSGVGYGVGVVGSGVGFVGKAGKIMTKTVTGPFGSKKTRSPSHENGIPGAPATPGSPM
eukprot:c27993_g1_i2 orf=555-2063(-)